MKLSLWKAILLQKWVENVIAFAVIIKRFIQMAAEYYCCLLLLQCFFLLCSLKTYWVLFVEAIKIIIFFWSIPFSCVSTSDKTPTATKKIYIYIYVLCVCADKPYLHELQSTAQEEWIASLMQCRASLPTQTWMDILVEMLLW